MGNAVRSMLGAQRELAQFFYLQRMKGFPPPAELGFDEDASTRFHDLLRASSRYLEFGSGGSTLAADRRGIPALTVESDRFYARTVRAALSPSTQVEVMDVYLGITGEWSIPLFRRLTERRMKRWRKYSRDPFLRLAEKGWFPDFVLVDGRFRRACVLETARNALASGHDITIMFDDYYNPGREHYHMVEAVVGSPERIGRAGFFRVARGGSARDPTEPEMADAYADFR